MKAPVGVMARCANSFVYIVNDLKHTLLVLTPGSDILDRFSWRLKLKSGRSSWKGVCSKGKLIYPTCSHKLSTPQAPEFQNKAQFIRQSGASPMSYSVCC